jgi:enoyl-CoA hydratase/carnithine racemase
MAYQNLTVEHEGHVALVTFDRPDKANALNYAHLAEIEDVALSFRDEAETRVIIFNGRGKHFCSGADLTDAGDEYSGPMVLRRRKNRIGERAINAILGIDQITIAAWHGAAMGGGACITTACDFRIGADDCFMQYPEIDIGVNLQWKSLPLITHLAGPARAKRLVAGGDRVHAQELKDWGILDELVPRSDLMSAAHKLAEFYVNKPPMAVQMIKRSINAISGALDQSIMHMDSDQHMLTSTSQDRAEAVKAYLAKSKPTFTGD